MEIESTQQAQLNAVQRVSAEFKKRLGSVNESLKKIVQTNKQTGTNEQAAGGSGSRSLFSLLSSSRSRSGGNQRNTAGGPSRASSSQANSSQAGEESSSQPQDGHSQTNQTQSEQTQTAQQQDAGPNPLLEQINAQVPQILSESAAFNAQLKQLQIATNADPEQLKTLKAIAIKVGPQNQTSPQAILASMEKLSSSGLSVEQIQQALPDVLNLAGANKADVGAVADLSAGVLTGLNLDASKMRSVADTLTFVSKNTNTDLIKLATAVKELAPLSQKANLGLSETATVAGVLTASGIEAGKVSTVFHNAMANLSDPASKASKALKNMGISMKDSQGEMRTFPEILQEMAKVSDGGNLKETLTHFQDVLGKDAGAGFSKLVQEKGVKGVTQFASQGDGVDGIAQTLSDKNADNAQASFSRLQETIKSLKLVLGTSMLPVLNDVLDKITSVVASVSEWMLDNPALAQTLMTVMLGVYGVTKAMGFATSLMTSFNMLSGQGSGNAGSFAGSLGRLKNIIPSITGAFTGLNAAMLLNPYVLIGVGLVALAALIYKYFDPIKAFFTGLWNGIVEGFAPIMDLFEPFKPVLNAVGEVFSWLGEKIGGVIGWIADFFEPVQSTQEELQNLTNIGESVGKVIGGIFSFIIKAVSFFPRLIKSGVDSVMSFFGIGDDEEEGSEDAVKTIKKVEEVNQSVPRIPASSPSLDTESELSQALSSNSDINQFISSNQNGVADNSVSDSIFANGSVLPAPASSSINVGGISINVTASPEQSSMDIAQKVREQFEMMMAEIQRNQRGVLYDG